MSLGKRLRTIMACLVLEGGVLLGGPMRVEAVQELMRALSVPKIVKEDKQEGERGGPP